MSDFTEAQWARAGKMARARSEAVRRPVRRAVAMAVVRGLESVRFASAAARTLALASRLAWPNFEDVAKGSARGYTIADVRDVLREMRTHG